MWASAWVVFFARQTDLAVLEYPLICKLKDFHASLRHRTSTSFRIRKNRVTSSSSGADLIISLRVTEGTGPIYD